MRPPAPCLAWARRLEADNLTPGELRALARSCSPRVIADWIGWLTATEHRSGVAETFAAARQHARAATEAGSDVLICDPVSELSVEAGAIVRIDRGAAARSDCVLHTLLAHTSREVTERACMELREQTGARRYGALCFDEIHGIARMLRLSIALIRMRHGATPSLLVLDAGASRVVLAYEVEPPRDDAPAHWAPVVHAGSCAPRTMDETYEAMRCA